jgi:hypothetical protein
VNGAVWRDASNNNNKKRSGLKSAGYKNCTRSFKIVYLKWTLNTLKNNYPKCCQHITTTTKITFSRKVLESVLKI